MVSGGGGSSTWLLGDSGNPALGKLSKLGLLRATPPPLPPPKLELEPSCFFEFTRLLVPNGFFRIFMTTGPDEELFEEIDLRGADIVSEGINPSEVPTSQPRMMNKIGTL